jgi:organic hydroperoxide reductase OsmC/OhrA
MVVHAFEETLMHPFPHHYQATVKSTLEQKHVDLESPGLANLVVAPPAEFGGTGNDWSPETLLTGAIASCFVLGFRTIAEASKLSWISVACSVDGTLDRIDNAMRFTEITLKAELVVPDQRNADRAVRILSKAKANCLVTNSLSAIINFESSISLAG